jgi:acetyl-CoA carboxylase beta subunit
VSVVPSDSNPRRILAEDLFDHGIIDAVITNRQLAPTEAAA